MLLPLQTCVLLQRWVLGFPQWFFECKMAWSFKRGFCAEALHFALLFAAVGMRLSLDHAKTWELSVVSLSCRCGWGCQVMARAFQGKEGGCEGW